MYRKLSYCWVGNPNPVGKLTLTLYLYCTHSNDDPVQLLFWKLEFAVVFPASVSELWMDVLTLVFALDV